MLLLLRDAPTIGWNLLSGSLPSGLTFTRASAAAYFDSAGLMQTAATNAPRFDYDPVALTPKGLLIEEQRTNLFPRSEKLTDAAWGKLGSPTMTDNNAGAPDGTSTFNKFVRTITGPSYLQMGLSKAASSLPYALTVFAKKGAAGNYLAVRLQGAYPNRMDCVFNLNSGTAGTPVNFGSGFAGTAAIQAIGGGVYRVTLSSPSSDTAGSVSALFSFNSNGSNQVDATDSVSNSEGYLWGAQLEQAAFATSYIKTEASAATRAADALSTTSIPWFNAAAGTLAAEFIPIKYGSYMQLAEFDDGTLNNRVSLSLHATGAAREDIGSGGTLSVNTLATGTVAEGAVNKAAVSYADRSPVGAVALSGSGTTGNGSGTGVFVAPSGVNILRLGNRSATAAPFSGWMRNFKYWNKALSAAQLQAVTR